MEQEFHRPIKLGVDLLFLVAAALIVSFLCKNMRTGYVQRSEDVMRCNEITNSEPMRTLIDYSKGITNGSDSIADSSTRIITIDKMLQWISTYGNETNYVVNLKTPAGYKLYSTFADSTYANNAVNTIRYGLNIQQSYYVRDDLSTFINLFQSDILSTSPASVKPLDRQVLVQLIDQPYNFFGQKLVVNSDGTVSIVSNLNTNVNVVISQGKLVDDYCLSKSDVLYFIVNY